MDKPVEQKDTVDLQIGQIVYILSDKAESIVPAIVVEELVHKKLDGNSVSWKVAVGPPEKNKTISSNKISGKIYSSLDEIQEVMLARLNKFVYGLVNKAEKRTEAWYGKQLTKASKATTKDKSEKIDPADLLDIIDGREKGKQFRKLASQSSNDTSVSNLMNNIPLTTTGDPRKDLRNKLYDLARVPDDEDQPGEFLITDDGRKIPVKYNEAKEQK